MNSTLHEEKERNGSEVHENYSSTSVPSVASHYTIAVLGYFRNIRKNGEEIMTYQDRITIEPGKRGGRPCIRNMRITVYDVLGWLASGMTSSDILAEYPELDEDDIKACLAFAADREHHLASITAA